MVTIIQSGMWVETDVRGPRGGRDKFPVIAVEQRDFAGEPIVVLKDGSGGQFERHPDECNIVNPPTGR